MHDINIDHVTNYSQNVLLARKLCYYCYYSFLSLKTQQTRLYIPLYVSFLLQQDFHAGLNYTCRHMQLTLLYIIADHVTYSQ